MAARPNDAMTAMVIRLSSSNALDLKIALIPETKSGYPTSSVPAAKIHGANTPHVGRKAATTKTLPIMVSGPEKGAVSASS